MYSQGHSYLALPRTSSIASFLHFMGMGLQIYDNSDFMIVQYSTFASFQNRCDFYMLGERACF